MDEILSWYWQVMWSGYSRAACKSYFTHRLGGNRLPGYSLPGCTSIIYYYYVAISTGLLLVVILLVLLSALRNVVWDLLLLGYYSYYMSRLAKIPLYLVTLWPGLWLYWISSKFSSFCDITQTCNYPNYSKYISEILWRLLNSLSKFWLWIFSQWVLSFTTSPSRSPDLCSPLAEFPSNDITTR